MFDLIGAALSIVFLFAIGGIVSIVLALITWLSLLRRGTRRKRYIVAAVLLPLATAAWFTICTILLPGESIFGDIDQPLPHHFKVTALGKMSDDGTIESDNDSYTVRVPPCRVSHIAVNGEFVAGRCSYKYFPAPTSEPAPAYFLFNTGADETATYADESGLDQAVGHHIELVELQFFRSPTNAMRRHIETAIELTPPAAVLLFLILAIIGEHRRAGRRRLSHI